jgi:hypothetical protein
MVQTEELEMRALYIITLANKCDDNTAYCKFTSNTGNLRMYFLRNTGTIMEGLLTLQSTVLTVSTTCCSDFSDPVFLWVSYNSRHK